MEILSWKYHRTECTDIIACVYLQLCAHHCLLVDGMLDMRPAKGKDISSATTDANGDSQTDLQKCIGSFTCVLALVCFHSPFAQLIKDCEVLFDWSRVLFWLTHVCNLADGHNLSQNFTQTHETYQNIFRFKEFGWCLLFSFCWLLLSQYMESGLHGV